METFSFFRLRFRRAYDSAYDSDFRFSLGHKHSYVSDYDSDYDSDSDSDSDSVASENQPLNKLHRHATYQQIMVYQSRGPQFANHFTQENTGLCHHVISVRKTSVVDIKC